MSRNRRFATAVFGEGQTVRQKVLLPPWVHARPNWTVHAVSAFLPFATELRTLLEVSCHKQASLV